MSSKTERVDHSEQWPDVSSRDFYPKIRHFVDHRRVKLVAGSGGKGVCSFHSEPRKEWGGPDGGNGGDGGNIIIKGMSSTQRKIC